MNKNTRDKYKQVKELLLNRRCLMPVQQSEQDNKNQFKELSIAVLEYDLRRIKNNVKYLTINKIRRLDEYFDKICLMLGYNSEIFKDFIRKLAREGISNESNCN